MIWMDVDTNVIVPVNILPLVDDTDFKSVEIAIAYNAAGIALTWHFYKTDGTYTATAVTPTTGNNYDWAEDLADKGTYCIELPASGGTAGAMNDTEGVGWFTGTCTGVLPWRGPTIGFRAAAINNALIDGAVIGVNVDTITASAIKNASFDADTNSTAYATNKLALAMRVLMDELNLNHLMKDATAAADMTTEVPDNTVMARILGNGDTSTFVPSTDGLHAAGVDIDAILADTNEMQVDLVDGGRLDLILDAILLDTGTTLDGRLPAALTAGGKLQVSLEEIKATALTEGGAGRLAAAFVKLFDVATPLLVASEAMRGTDGATLASMWTDAKAGYLTGAVALEATSQTLISRLGAWTGTGINTVLGAFRAMMAKAVALTPTDISTGTTYDNTTDSVEAIRDTAPMGTAMRGTDNAALEATLTAIKGVGWTDETLVTIQSAAEAAGGGGGLNAQQTRDAMKLAPTAGDPAAGSIDAELDSLLINVADVPTVTEMNARTLPSADYVVTTDTIAGVTDKANFTLSSAYDAAKTAAQPDEYDSQLTAISDKIVTVQADTDNIQMRLPAELIDGKMDAITGALSDEAIAEIADAVTLATGALTDDDIPAIAAAIKAALGEMDITIVSPANVVGNIGILRGATYSADTTQITLTVTENAVYDVDIDTPVFNLAGVEFDATATEETPGTLIITWDMTETETLDLPLGRLPYSVSWQRDGETLPEIIAGYATIEDIPGTVEVE